MGNGTDNMRIIICFRVKPCTQDPRAEGVKENGNYQIIGDLRLRFRIGATMRIRSSIYDSRPVGNMRMSAL